jgi:AcrR family transcriptional regulator
MAKKSVKNIKEKAVGAALDLAVQKGWQNVTLSGIARKAKIPLATLHQHFADRFDVITAWGRIIDRRVLAGAGDSGSPRDRLFDLLMARLDVLNETRGGAISILESFRCDPKQSLVLLPHLCRSMGWMLDAAGIETGGVKGTLKVAALTAIYLKTLYVWRGDESADMAKTMAALDRALGHAEQWAGKTGF